MTVNLFVAAAVFLFISTASALVFFFIAYFRTKKRYESALEASILEKDSIIKDSIRLDEENKKLKEISDSSASALEAARALSEKLRDEDKILYAKVSALSAENESLSEKISAQKTDYESRLEKQKNELLQLEDRFKEAFENLSSKMLEDRGKKFLELSRENIYGILNPLSEKINEFQKRVEETYDKESKLRFSLQSEIGRLVETENAMKKAAENLTTALKGSGKVQGDWGEMILEQLLENSGLAEGMQYEIQKDMDAVDEFGKKIHFRPDVVVHLPAGRDLVIDSKVSLTDYEKYMSAYASGNAYSPENAAGHGGHGTYSPQSAVVNGNGFGGTPGQAGPDTARHLKAHIASIKRHITELSAKNYSGMLKSNSLDAVIMFIPIEFAYTSAVSSEEGRDILNFASGKNVIIATPSIVILILKIVYNLWIQEKSMEKAAEVMKIAGQLYDKFCLFAENMESVGKSIGKSHEAYESAMTQLVSGKGNIVGRLEKMKQLGARALKSIEGTRFDAYDNQSDKEEI